MCLEHTGLPFVVFISQKGGAKHDVRVKVARSAKVRPSDDQHHRSPICSHCQKHARCARSPETSKWRQDCFLAMLVAMTTRFALDLMTTRSFSDCHTFRRLATLSGVNCYSSLHLQQIGS